MAEAYNEEVVALLQKELTTYRSKQITTVLTLLNEGNTVPFIARYRKEMTGSDYRERKRVGTISRLVALFT